MALSSIDKMELDRLKQRKLAYELLVELLAHQFAFPVKWIDTQDSLFLAKEGISRFIELGPARVLAGLQRQFLASTQDFADLRYEYTSQSNGDDEPTETTPISSGESQPATPKPLAAPAAITSSAERIAATSIADVPIPPLEIVSALVAYKLKKTIDQVARSKSIKELSGGKSTLQNELIGDLAVEFGTTPDGAEDLSLEFLAEAFEVQHNGQPGKVSSSLIARFISSSMPAKFNLNSIRDHLSGKWGLGPSRQTSILLFAMTINSVSGSGRLASIGAAKDLLDLASSKYAESCGIVLQAHGNSSAGQSEAATAVVDPSILAKITQDQRHLATKQLDALSDYLNLDTQSNSDLIIELEKKQLELQDNLAVWISEFGEDFASGIKPCFDSRKSRNFNFSWNQARQEIFDLFYNADKILLPAGLSAAEGKNLLQMKCLTLSNKSNEQALKLVQVLLKSIPEEEQASHPFTKFGKDLISTISRTLHQPPHTKFIIPTTMPKTTIGADCAIKYHEVQRTNFSGTGYTDLLRNGLRHGSACKVSRVCLYSCQKVGRQPDYDLTELLLSTVSKMLNGGETFAGKNVLVTGAGPGSIGAEIISSLLAGGAHVIVTTSREPSASSKFYRKLFAKYGSRGSELIVLPFNQASANDCKDLMEYIYSASGLARNLDAIIPFAAVSEGNVEIDDVGGKSELALRLMLTNIIRLLGHLTRIKAELSITCRPTQVILPLSPNHGIFGGDGLYSETKIGLEALLNRYHSESWSDAISVCGAIIGWTRGTGLMQQNDIVAEAIESNGVLTFSQKEMALNVLALITPAISLICEDFPVIADFSGGLACLEDCKSVLSEARERINLNAQIAKAVEEEDRHESNCTTIPRKSKALKPLGLRSTLQIPFPPLPDFEKDVKPLQHLQGMVDLSGTVVIVGFSELGPWGSARTRWEMESQGKLNQSGFVELAWMMNLIKHFDGDTSKGYYVGWVDAQTGDQVHDSEVEAKYGNRILANSGIRFIDPELFGGYDPNKKEFLQEIAIEEDMQFETDLATAELFKNKYGSNIFIRQIDDQDQCRVRIKSGTRIMVPKALALDSGVAGQLPKGWNPAKYGIQEDIIRQVDPVTVYTLCCVAEALFSAGITNAMEIYKHIHSSEVGNFIGSSMGGSEKTRDMYRNVYLDKEVQGDIIQETFLNTPAAWVNMLLLGSTGPIKTPVGACATGVESIDIGYDSILSGKTKFCIVGGTDNFHEDESYGFATMKATVNTANELSHGRTPAEMSRPTAESRAGFMESQGCGVQIMCTAELAIEMGLPIYGIVAGSTMAADKISRSVPAPGQGVLTFARETPDAIYSPLLSLSYRREQMQKAIFKGAFSHDASSPNSSTPISFTPFESDAASFEGVRIEQSSSHFFASSTLSAQLIKNTQRQWGNEFRRLDENISPLRASLAVWGLTVDDINVCSLHATSTKANDKNEPGVINQQMNHLGRSGAPMMAICQKYLTGHPKAPAASWMLNGCLQVLSSGLIPGNYNADNVDPYLEKFEHIVFPTEPIQTKEVKAFVLTSFGFGQKGGQLVGVHPKYLFATMKNESFERYTKRFTARKQLANRAFVKAFLSNTIFTAQLAPPYHASDEAKIFLDPLARISENSKTGEYIFNPKQLHGIPDREIQHSSSYGSLDMDADIPFSTYLDITAATSLSKSWIEQALAERGSETVGVGIDVEELDKFTSDSNENFLARNYTIEEQRYAKQSLNPHSTFVSRWCAKEAVFKSMGTQSKGAGAPLRDIEIYSHKGVPKVRLHGDAAVAAAENGIQEIQLNLTYSSNNVVAVALALRGK